MDPLTAVSLVGTVITLVEFSRELLSSAAEIYRNGALTQWTDVETATNSLLELNGKLRTATGIGEHDPALGKLCDASQEVANELLSKLFKLKVQGKKGKWKSMRAALESVWSKGAIDSLEKRLAKFREELNLRITANLRERFDLVIFQQSDQFNELDTRTQEILDAVIKNRSVFKSMAEAQRIEIERLQNDANNRNAETNATVLEQHAETRIQIVEVAQFVNQRIQEEHEVTRREISQLMQALEYLKEEMKKKDGEVREFLKAYSRQRSPKRRMRLQKLSNAASAALFKLESLYRILLDVLVSLQGRAKEFWGSSRIQPSRNVSSHPTKALSTIVSSEVIAVKLIQWQTDGSPNQSIIPAIHLYYHYFYRHLSSRGDLVDAAQMESQWKARNPIDHFMMSSHIECLSIHGSDCSIPSVWLMAVVIASVQRCILPASDTYSIMAEVFERSRQSHMVEGTFTKGSRASRLRSDFEFWRQFSQSRHLDQAVNKCLMNNNNMQSLDQFGTADREEMVSFLVWLIGNREKPKDDVRPTLLVQSARVFLVALSMQAIGLHIATWTERSPSVHIATQSCWPLVLHGDSRPPLQSAIEAPPLKGGQLHIQIFDSELQEIDLETCTSGNPKTGRNYLRLLKKTYSPPRRIKMVPKFAIRT